jgi:hypothetical protein
MSNTPSPSHAETLFAAALDLTDPAECAAFLERACGGDATLRAEVEPLLAAHAEAKHFMNTAAAADTTATPPHERAGQRIGRYKLLERIGEGGFGEVRMAEQEEPVRRRVALEIIKLGMDTPEVVARFEAERQALALMDHPGIARGFDGGTTETGRPFFVMELVKGVPITRYCDELRLAARRELTTTHEVAVRLLALDASSREGLRLRTLVATRAGFTNAAATPSPDLPSGSGSRASDRFPSNPP